MPNGSDTRILSYHDVLLRESDVSLLRGPHWLNDQIIAFYFEYLLQEVHPMLRETVSLIPGAMSFLLINSDPTEAAVIFETLELHTKDLVVFAVNDNPDVDVAAGGFHWSCLAYHRHSNTFRHYDSAKPHNSKVARSLAGAAAPLVRSRNLASSGSSSNSNLFPEYVEAVAPQQQNSNDCGMYLLAATKTLCGSLAASRQKGNPSTVAEEVDACLLQSITPAAVAAMRKELLNIVVELSQRAA